MANEGTLRITVIEAHLEHDTEAIGKMDPYVKMSSRDGDEQWKSGVMKRAGKNPVWDHDHVWDMRVHYFGDELEYIVMDHEKIGKDDEIGKGKTKIAALAIDGGFDEWFDIEFKGEKAGRLHLKGEWFPKA